VSPFAPQKKRLGTLLSRTGCDSVADSTPLTPSGLVGLRGTIGIIVDFALF